MFGPFCVVRGCCFSALPFERWPVILKALASTLFVSSIAFRGYVTLVFTSNIPTFYFKQQLARVYASGLATQDASFVGIQLNQWGCFWLKTSQGVGTQLLLHNTVCMMGHPTIGFDVGFKAHLALEHYGSKLFLDLYEPLQGHLAMST